MGEKWEKNAMKAEKEKIFLAGGMDLKRIAKKNRAKDKLKKPKLAPQKKKKKKKKSTRRKSKREPEKKGGGEKTSGGGGTGGDEKKRVKPCELRRKIRLNKPQKVRRRIKGNLAEKGPGQGGPFQKLVVETESTSEKKTSGETAAERMFSARGTGLVIARKEVRS